MHLDTSLVPAWVTDFFSAPAAVRLGWVCLHSLWQGVAVAVVLAMALRLIPRQSSAALVLRYRLAAAALAALPVAAGGTFFLLPAWSDAVKPQPTQMNIAPRPATVAEAAPGMAGFGATPAPLLLRRQHVQPDSLVRLAAWLPLVALAWTVGAALAAVRMACGWWITRRLVARATPAADGRLQGRVNRWRRIMRIDGAVRILTSAAVESPVVVGWLKPVIVWPAAALVGMPAHEIDAILAHELAHVRRRDALMNLLQACIDVLFFHHPAAWWISRQVRAEREHCADDLAVSSLEADRAGTRLSYARALLALEQRRQTAALAVAATGGRLLDRIRRLAGDDQEPAGTARLLAASLTAAVLLAVTVSFTATPRRATADELPQDTNTIKSLTPEQARKLVNEFRGVEMEVEPGFTDHFCLPLNGLKSLDAMTAQALAGYRGGTLSLGGLTTLDADSATALATLQSEALVLNGLTAITPAAAEALAAFDGTHLYLDGMTTLDAATAKALATFKGDTLSLDGLTTIDAATATVLVGCKGMWPLSLNRLRTIDAVVARALAAYDGDELTLNGLTTIDAATARALAASKTQMLSLDGLPRLAADTAKALGTFVGECVSLEGLVWLDAQTAKELAGSRAWSGRLPKLTTLDAAAATALSAFAGDELCLDGLTTLEPEIATALAGYAGNKLRLCGLTEVDPRVTAALAASRCKGLVLDGLTGLDASRARVFATFKGGGLGLGGLSQLDADAAEALATFKGMLHFNKNERVRTTYANAHPLDPTTVRVYAALFEGKVPTIQLDADMAAALADWPGRRLDLTGLARLDAPTARLLAGIESWNGNLPNLKALDSPDAVAIAQALATRKGPVLLPNLKKISPRTLSALLDKEDVDIPLIETLELIPEPDGSPTDDFVIPEKFQQRQRR